jgi:hypothetical protein
MAKSEKVCGGHVATGFVGTRPWGALVRDMLHDGGQEVGWDEYLEVAVDLGVEAVS